MKIRILIVSLLGVMLMGSSVYAAPIYFTADGVLPSELATLTAERNVFRAYANANGVSSLSMEGFESFLEGNPINFGPFTATLYNGSGFYQITGNDLITTEGNSVLDFITSGNTSVTFAFNNSINAFGIDITSIDFAPPTTVTFLDNLGNVLSDFAIHGEWAGATFFGVYNNQDFSMARFDFTGSEYLNFDQLEYGVRVPEPSTMLLLGSGLLGLLGLRKKFKK